MAKEKTVIIKSRKPFAKFTGISHKENGKNKQGMPNFEKAKSYVFDKNCRYEATEEDKVDLQYFIDKGFLTVIELGSVEDKVDIQDFTKAELIADLEKNGVKEIDGKELSRSNKAVLLAYLEEVYYQKLNAKEE